MYCKYQNGSIYVGFFLDVEDFLFTWKCVCSSSDFPWGIIIWLDLRVCCVCGRAALLWDITKAWKYKLQGSYLAVEAPCIFIKNSHAAAEAPLHHNVKEPHKGKHMRPGLSL